MVIVAGTSGWWERQREDYSNEAVFLFLFTTDLAVGNRRLVPNPPQGLADAMHGAWVAFAKNGDPGWPAYDSERRMTMCFDLRSGAVSAPLRAERVLWDGVR
jgi:carboxylesterase type B